MKKKKGFATTGILYTLLLLFVGLLFGVLQNLQNKKTILDNLKMDTVNALACDCDTILSKLDNIENYVQGGVSSATMTNAGYVSEFLTQGQTVTATKELSLTLTPGTYYVYASINNYRNLDATSFGLWSKLETSWSATRIYTNDTYYYKVDGGLVTIAEETTFKATYTAGATGTSSHGESYTCILTAIKLG